MLGQPLCSIERSSLPSQPRRTRLLAAPPASSWSADARSLWLSVPAGGGKGELRLATPSNRAALPPGMYLLVLLSSKGVPSEGRLISFP